MATYAVTLKGPRMQLPSKDHIQLSWTTSYTVTPNHKSHNENSVCFPTQLEHGTALNQLNVSQMNTVHTRQSLNQLNVSQMYTAHTRQSLNQLNVSQMNTAHTRQSWNQLNVHQMNTAHARQSWNQLNVSQMNTKAIKVPARHLSFAPCTVHRHWPSCSTVSESTPSRTASQRVPAFSSSIW